VILAEKPTRVTDVLLHGVPSTKRPFLSLITLLLNIALVGMTVDAMFRARWYHRAEDLSFVRLGYVSHHEATFVIREPDQSKMPVSLELRPKEAGTLAGVNIWLPGGGITFTTNETDFTRSITVPFSTSVQRRYEWRTSNGFTGEVLSAPRTGHLPEVESDKFTFLSTSCILSRFPYNPLDDPLAIPGLRHLARKLPELNAQFMMFLGDFIYVDVPERFGSSVEEYRMQYRQVYASPDWAPVSNISWIHTFDDHEISNDWSSRNTGVYNASMDPWHIYQGRANPPTSPVPGIWNTHREGATWFEFVQGPASFFMMDTRSYRSSNNVPYLDEDKTMLGEDQLADLLAWLARPEPRGVKWKVVGSSIPFTKNWPVNRKDTWGGFLVERKKILEAMWDSGARGMSVIILSGDRHEFAATKFPPPADSAWPLTAAAYEFSTSPLNQFASPIKSYRQTDDEDVKLG
jgi:alkaline phosphatase D